MVATLDDVSAVLGKYLLAGWTMDEACDREDCPGCPIMHKDGVRFCVRCDGEPTSGSLALPLVVSQAIPPGNSLADALYNVSPSTSSNLSQSQGSSSSIKPNGTLPEGSKSQDLAQTRRNQSDTASTEIGKRLLKGWTLLGEECPNETCYGIPLMQAPNLPAKSEDQGSSTTKSRKGSKKSVRDPRKWCVICSRSYMNAEDQGMFDKWSTLNEVPISVANGPAPQESIAMTGKRAASSELVDAAKQPKRLATDGLKLGIVEQQNSITTSAFSNCQSEAIAELQVSVTSLTRHLAKLNQANPLDVKAISQTATALSNVVSGLHAIQSLA